MFLFTWLDSHDHFFEVVLDYISRFE